MAIFGVKLPRIYNPWFVALVATLGGALFGFDISSMSAQTGTQQYIDYFAQDSRGDRKDVCSWRTESLED
jgi:predicted nucleotidyltransferase